jgi:predicted DNA-binding transcriptional regulator YafY
MARKARLLRIIDLLGDGALHRAGDLAARLGVSERTIYRDMARLAATGLPLRGTPGTGYRLEEALALPPLALSAAELEALNLGLVIVGEAADPELRAAAEALAARIEAVLPGGAEAGGAAWEAALAPLSDPTRNLSHRALIQAAIRARQKLRLSYAGEARALTLRPLRLGYRGRLWHLLGWCEEAADFGEYRLDLIEGLEALPELFVAEPGKGLADYGR